MKLYKKFVLPALLCFLLIAVAATYQITCSVNEDLKILFNDEFFEPKENDGTELRPITFKDRTYLPVRAVLEKAGAYVGYDDKTKTAIIKSENTLLNRANLVLYYLKYKNAEQLSSLVHPKDGVTFSPYATVGDTDLRFSAEEVKDIINDKVYVWGNYDGSGETIELDFNGYYDKFLYTSDFINAERIGNNTEIQTGNSINNIRDAYPDAKFIEYNFDGFDPQYDGMDWQSIRLVFEEFGGQWYLVAIVHDCWTI